MIANCRGCWYELNEAYKYQQYGLHLASTITRKTVGERGHFGLIMVDDKGKIVVE